MGGDPAAREAGATSYDLWGLAHPGIAHFKTGFGGREVRYVGAWDLVLDPLGRRAYETAQAVRVRIARRRRPGSAATGYAAGALWGDDAEPCEDAPLPRAMTTR